MTLLLAWSAEEAGRIIETYKIFERKPPDLIMEKQESNSLSKVYRSLEFLTFMTRASQALENLKQVNQIQYVNLMG